MGCSSVAPSGFAGCGVDDHDVDAVEVRRDLRLLRCGAWAAPHDRLGIRPGEVLDLPPPRRGDQRPVGPLRPVQRGGRECPARVARPS